MLPAKKERQRLAGLCSRELAGGDLENCSDLCLPAETLEAVHQLAVSADGRWLCAAGGDREICIYNLENTKVSPAANVAARDQICCFLHLFSGLAASGGQQASGHLVCPAKVLGLALWEQRVGSATDESRSL